MGSSMNKRGIGSCSCCWSSHVITTHGDPHCLFLWALSQKKHGIYFVSLWPARPSPIFNIILDFLVIMWLTGHFLGLFLLHQKWFLCPSHLSQVWSVGNISNLRYAGDTLTAEVKERLQKAIQMKWRGRVKKLTTRHSENRKLWEVNT